MGLQVFGTKKCAVTRKAERFFKDRGLAFQFINLAEKGISPGELRIVKAAVGAEALIDLQGARAKEKGLAWMEFDAEEAILADPLLLRTPVVRDGPRAAIGDNPGAWAAMLPKKP
jgi:arsenate reductase-like glutaredoxin family protein